MKSSSSGYYDQTYVVEFYDPVYERLWNADINFYLEYSRLATGRILELGCGTGRVLLPIALSGYKITGIDLSTYMLAKCQEKLAQQPPKVKRRVKLVQGDMCNFKTNEIYSMITVPFRGFQHLTTVEEQKACLGSAHQHLASDGILILDLFHPFPPRLVANPQYASEKEDFPETKLTDGRTLRRTNRILECHRDQQYNLVEIIYYVSYPDGKTERLKQTFPMRYFFRYEVEHLLNLCGFQVINLFGNFDKSEFSNDSPEMIFIAKKR